MTREEKIIEKIQQLLALSKSSNENEAAVAAAKAAELMQKYNVAEAKVYASVVASVLEKKTDLGYNKVQPWALRLAQGLSKAFLCRLLISGGEFKFIGRPRNVEAAAFGFDSLSWKLIDLAQIRTTEYTKEFKHNHGFSPRDAGPFHNPTFWRNSWILGAAAGISQKLIDQYRKFEVTPTGKEIILQHTAEADQFIDEKYPGIGSRNSSDSSVRRDAYALGVVDGYSLEINHAIQSGDATPLLSKWSRRIK